MKLRRQSGATAVEFALGLLIFLAFLLGITDFARMLFTWNAASEATRAGARYAVVCGTTTNADEVLAKMQALLPQVADINVNWVPAGCNVTTCEGVRVSIANLNYQWISPVPGAVIAAIPMPSFSTYLPREIMRADNNSEALCSGTL